MINSPLQVFKLKNPETKNQMVIKNETGCIKTNTYMAKKSLLSKTGTTLNNSPLSLTDNKSCWHV